jgi:GNAT superfamily N-acetyltransferase
LGYSLSPEDIASNLAHILVSPDYETVVIQKQAEVVDWMALRRTKRIEDVHFLQVAALVTDERYRSQGLGKALMSYAEIRAQAMDLPFVGLHSSLRRADAHRFYEAIGYAKAKESYFFKKDLLQIK